MDALARHCLTGVISVSSEAASSCSPRPPLRRRSISIPSPDKNLGSGHAVLLQRLPIRPPPFSPLCVASSSEANKLTPDSHVEAADPSKTVRVRFVLHKECLFGQQFSLVGDDQLLGLWNPSNAIPMEWSPGHIWIAELDLPIGRQIKFKFILRSSSGAINWQPGLDRSLQTWETTKTMVVSGDWAHAEYQKITEEEPSLLMVEHNDTGIMVEETSQSRNHDKNLSDYEGGLLFPVLAPIPASVCALGSSDEILAAKAINASYMPDEVERGNSSQGKEETPEESCRNLPLEETTILMQKPHGDEYEEVQTNDGILTEDKIQPKEPKFE